MTDTERALRELVFRVTIQVLGASTDDMAERELGALLADGLADARHIQGYYLSRAALGRAEVTTGPWGVLSPLPTICGARDPQMWDVFDTRCDDMVSFRSEREALAVRDVLNRVAASRKEPT